MTSFFSCVKVFGQIFVFHFKPKYRRKLSNILYLLIILVILLNFFICVNCKCTDLSCMNGGQCKNDTCICTDGWQGSECQFCGGKVRYVFTNHTYLYNRILIIIQFLG